MGSAITEVELARAARSRRGRPNTGPRRRRFALVAAAAAWLGALGCSVPKEAEFPRVRDDVHHRTGYAPFWNRGGERDADVAKAVHRMLARPLRAAEAVQIALLNNPKLQATYEDLAIAQADAVQAGLLKNPVFTATYHVPVSGGADTNHFDFGVEQDFLDVLMLPARKRLASAEFEAAKLRVGSAVVGFAFDVRVAYFTLHGAQQIAAMRAAVLEAATGEMMLAEAQHRATNISDLDLENQHAAFAEARLGVARADTDVVFARERLNRLLGLAGVDTTWRIADQLPPIPAAEPPLENLESVAIAQRLDVDAARHEVYARSYALGMAKTFRWVPAVSVGANVDRESDGPLSAGPQGSLSPPIFDQQQALIARLESELRRSERALAGLAVDARAEVREARARLLHDRSVVDFYRRELVPTRERIAALSLQQYNSMLMGAYQLLQIKQAEVATYREYIEAVRDYWIARAELGRACGGRLPGEAQESP